MHPFTHRPSRAERQARLDHLDALIRQAHMKVPDAMRELGREVFADGAIPRKQKELTALAVAVAGNCWE